MTISDYVAIAVLLLLLVWAVAAWIRQASRDAGSAGAPQGRSDSGGRLYEEIEAVLFKDRLRCLRAQE